uniref:Uncharacterized protein n=1 Tax=Arundo donax TaxID=35708 RepID=A0A0A9EBP0_ARUDO
MFQVSHYSTTTTKPFSHKQVKIG